MEERTQAKLLATKVWDIANSLRGNMDSRQFKDYILALLFYRFLSDKDKEFRQSLLLEYGMIWDEKILPEERKVLGFYVPEYCSWDFLQQEIKNGNFTIRMLERAFSDIQASVIGGPAENMLDGIFTAIDLRSAELGKNEEERAALLAEILVKIDAIPFSDADDLGTVYMTLLSKFASDSGKKAGQFFTNPQLAKLLGKLVTMDLKEVRSACDCCAGSGSLLMSVMEERPVKQFYGAELLLASYNMLRMNFLMHGIPYSRFHGYQNDLLKHDPFVTEKDGKLVPLLFHTQVANPPFSQHYHPEALKDDLRFAGLPMAGAKAADLTFVQHILYHMAPDGVAAVILPVNALSRTGADAAVRKSILPYVDAVIMMPSCLFLTTGYQCCVMVLKRQSSNSVFFINASSCFVQRHGYKELTDEHIAIILDAYRKRETQVGFCANVSKTECNYAGWNLIPKRYVPQNVETVNIGKENKKAKNATLTMHDNWKKMTARLKEFRSVYREFPVEGVRLQSLVDVFYGRSPKVTGTGDVLLYGSSGQSGITNTALVDKECVIIGRKGTLNHPTYSDKPCWVIDTAFYCTAKEDIDINMKWLFYWAQMVPWADYNDAGGVPSLSILTVKEMEVSMPARAVQDAIVAILDAGDAALKKEQEALDARKRLLYGIKQQII